MQNEQNQVTEGVAIHDIVVIQRHQKSKPDGTKRGYTWGRNEEIGVVMQHSPQGIMIIKPDLEETEYKNEVDESDDYYYTVAKGSEIEYGKKIDEEGKKEQKKRDESQEKIMKLKQWKHDFEYSISTLGRMGRFIKAFVQK